MLAASEAVEQIVQLAKQLSPRERVRVVQRITETLMPLLAEKSQPLQFGKYKDKRMSTIEDFAVAEWHPTDEDF